MRILIAIHNHGVVGGAETYLRRLLPRLRERGHELALLTERDANPGEAAIDDLAPGTPRWASGLLGARRCVDDLASWRPEVAYLHGLEDLALEESVVAHVPSAFYAHAY